MTTRPPTSTSPKLPDGQALAGAACSGSCVIDPWEFVKFPASMLAMNPILAIAATHGCPADGVLYPKPVEGIRYTRIDYSDGTIELRWESCQNTQISHP